MLFQLKITKGELCSCFWEPEKNCFKPLSSADIGSAQSTALLNNMNEDSEQALVEVSEHQMDDDLQYVDVEIDAKKADEVKEKKLI